MCDKVVPDCYKRQKMCEKTFCNYSYTSRFLIPITLKMWHVKLLLLILPQRNMFLNGISFKKCVIALDTCPFVFGHIPHQYMTQKMRDKVVFIDAVALKYCP